VFSINILYLLFLPLSKPMNSLKFQRDAEDRTIWKWTGRGPTREPSRSDGPCAGGCIAGLARTRRCRLSELQMRPNVSSSPSPTSWGEAELIDGQCFVDAHCGRGHGGAL